MQFQQVASQPTYYTTLHGVYCVPCLCRQGLPLAWSCLLHALLLRQSIMHLPVVMHPPLEPYTFLLLAFGPSHGNLVEFACNNFPTLRPIMESTTTATTRIYKDERSKAFK